MPRRKSPIFKLPVLIQFRVAADTYGKATAYLPVRDLLKAYFQIDDRDDGRKMREKLTGKLLTLDTALGLTLPAFLALLDLPVEDRHWQDLDPTQRRQRTLTAIKQLLLRESQVQPLLLVFENLHWLDTETQAILDSLIDSLPTARLLLLVTYRPEYQHAWGNKTYYTQLRLDPLPTASAEALLQALLGDDPSLVRLKQLVIERTEGNPFFLEESVRALVETGMLVGERGAYRLGQDPPTIQVAATVQAVLAARIDRLPPEEKRLLQTAAVIGTEVPFALLQAIVDLSEEKLRRGLGHLLAAEFLYETSLFPALAYTFKHALTHEVAYGSLLQERRRTLHARIVEAIERRYADRLTEQVEQLARHAVRGEVWDKAVTYCQQAGARAYDHAAFHEAVTAFEQALQALAHLPVDGDTQRQAIELHLALGFSLGALGEPRRRLVLLGEAEALARALDDQARLVQVLAQMTVVLRRMGDFDGAIAAGQEALEIAAARGDSTLHMQAALYLGMVYYDINDFGRAAELHRRNVEAVYRESGTLTLSTDMQIRSQAWLARSLGMLGAFAEGRRHGEEALRLATREGRGETSIVAHTCLGHLYLTQGDLEPAIRVMEQGLALWRTSGHRSWLQLIMANLSVAYALQGRLAEGRALLEEWISGRIMGSRQAPQRVVWLSQICDLAGHSNEAWQHACQALDLARQQKVRGDEAFALHQLGVVHTHADPPDVAQAEAHYQQALALAEELGMRPLVAHCHRGLGMLYAATGQQEQARSTLSTAIAMYRDMDMTFWLPETEAVPAQVEGR
jgi:tetratricopeptide (TPR) repeat protein